MTILFPSPIFGPIRSRRLGISLGVNLIPADGKLCTFDCLYCECGFNEGQRPHQPRPSRSQVKEALENQLRKMVAEHALPDVITFAGNGEPTAHPEFPAIIDDTLALRDAYCPKAKVAVLSNATMSHKPDVFEALLRVDDNIQKLDTVDTPYIQLVDRPVGRYEVSKVIDTLCAFKGKVIIQTMFMCGETHDGISVDNTGEHYVAAWLEAIKKISPSRVMVYTIDRETPEQGLLKASAQVLDEIAERVRALGLEASVSY
ncbi:MAG: radical SAM protein [Bacteroidaceae bacterium]|nr:radical SAM protein [Bacteroidaceae bacterium]